jgi:hypothetical protein
MPPGGDSWHGSCPTVATLLARLLSSVPLDPQAERPAREVASEDASDPPGLKAIQELDHKE